MSTSHARIALGVMLLAGAWLAAVSPVDAETVFFTADLSSANEVPPVVVPAGQKPPSGLAIIALNITRDGNAVVAAAFDAQIGLTGFAPTAVTGVRLHQGTAGANGPVIADSPISPGSPVPLPGGEAIFSVTNGALSRGQVADQIIDNPDAFYLNISTPLHPGGAVRAQLVRNAGFEGFGLHVFTNAGTYGPGALFQLQLFLGNLAAPTPLDLFVGLVLSPEVSASLCPGAGNLAIVFLGPSGVALQCLNSLTSPLALASNIVVPAPVALQKLTLLSVNLPGLGSGTHQVFACYRNPQAPQAPPVCDASSFATSP